MSIFSEWSHKASQSWVKKPIQNLGGMKGLQCSVPSEPGGDLTKPSLGRATQLLYPSAQTCWNDATRLHLLTSGRVKEGWRRVQTINTYNFNTVKEAYLNNWFFAYWLPWSCLFSSRHMDLQAADFPLSFPFRTGGYFLKESLRTVTSTLLCSRRAEAKPSAN